MEFQRTGVHPELKAREESNADASSSLPMHNPGRAHAFMDIAVGKDPIGTLVIEVFDDIAPNAAREFILRVSDDGGAGRAGGRGRCGRADVTCIGKCWHNQNRRQKQEENGKISHDVIHGWSA